jgi:predicted metal-binding membrane protein
VSGAVPARTASAGGARGGLLLGAGVAAAALAAWAYTLRMAGMAMPAPGAAPAFAEGAAFTAQWGVMMAAMMLPSAAPTILLYRTVARRLSAGGERAVPAPLFAAVYVGLWLAFGLPVYAGYVAVAALAARWPGFEAAWPYGVAGVLLAAGGYQLSAAKRACLRRCESPLGFLMRRWRGGYGATLRLAAEHAAYCMGCCWALMAILAAAGAMSMGWVAAITLAVFAEKVLPRGWRTARAIGAGLIVLGMAVAVRPELAQTLRGRDAPAASHPMPSP